MALARRYFQDIGTRLINQIWEYPDSIIVYNWLNLTETVSVFAHTKRDPSFPEFGAEAFEDAVSLLLQDSEREHLRLELSQSHWLRSIEVMSRNPVRSADAIHLVSALILKESISVRDARLIFVTSDQKLYNALVAEGIEVLHLWSCRCSNCGNEFIAQKYTRQECTKCGKICQKCKLQYCDNQFFFQH